MEIREQIWRKQEIFKETFHFCEREKILIEAIKESRKNTVICNNMTEVLERYMKKEKITVCIASHKVPGGLVMNGGTGWEEELCRCSTLYACLQTKELAEDYYKPSANKDDGRIIFIPNIICFRERSLSGNLLPKDEWYAFNVLMYHPHVCSYENRFALLQKGFME